MKPSIAAALIAGIALLVGACGDSAPPTKPAGGAKSGKTDVLEAGAKAAQANTPVGQMEIYLVGFHPLKDDPSHQTEAHHFCRQVNEDFAQCVLFDGNSREANLNGIEYIISEKLYDSLPKEERQYWHPHNYEILSGQLAAPRLPEAAEKELMRGKMNSYGKTWQVWNTGLAGRSGDKIPLGSPLLAWSFNRDGEAQPGLIKDRDKRLGIDTKAKRDGRLDLVGLAKPQDGVDALKGKFGRSTQDLAGVENKAAAEPWQ